MEKLITLELNKDSQALELHLNKNGAEYLSAILNKLISHNQNVDIDLMTPDWGGNELSSDRQNTSDEIELLHHLKILYWG